MNEKNEKIMVTIPGGISVKIRNIKEENAFWRLDAQVAKIFMALENDKFEGFDIELAKLNSMFEILVLLEMISPEVTINSKEEIIDREGIFKF